MAWIQKDGKTKAPEIAVKIAQDAAKEFGVPEGILLGTVECESNFRLGLVSSAGAVGPCQFKKKFEADYHRYAGFKFDIEGWESIRGMAAIYSTYSKWAVSRHGMEGEDIWRYALCAHRWGQNDPKCKEPRTQKRVLDVESQMKKNGLWYSRIVDKPATPGIGATAGRAVGWALTKLGCKYSQVDRLKATIFDCSSLVARAYSSQGIKWDYVGKTVPLSCEEVYSDNFEILWPKTYGEIGKKFGGRDILRLAEKAGDLQFLCTDSKTGRKNKITHVTMVKNATTIVHARGTAYGVREDPIGLYSGKVCAIVRYNPDGDLRLGMRGSRVQRYQEFLNSRGAAILCDGDYGPKTEAAHKKYQGEA